MKITEWIKNKFTKPDGKIRCKVCKCTQFYGGPEGPGGENITCAEYGREYTFYAMLGRLDGPLNSPVKRLESVYGDQVVNIAKPRLDAIDELNDTIESAIQERPLDYT